MGYRSDGRCAHGIELGNPMPCHFCKAVENERKLNSANAEIESLKAQLAECRDKSLEEAAQLVIRNPSLRQEIRQLKATKND